MAKKRKSDATRLDEIDRTIYSTFCSAANSLSQLYTQSMNQQRLSSQAGERHALEKLRQWILRQQEEGLRVTAFDVVAYIQNELEHIVEEAPISPSPVSTNSSGPGNAPATAGQGIRSAASDQQAKTSVFSNALSSPVRRSLQHYHNVLPSGNAPRDNDMQHLNSRGEDNSLSSNDSSMDMHADSP